MTRSDGVEVEGYPCTCHVGLQGNFCKHMAKVLLMNGMADIQLVKKYGTNLGTEVEMLCQLSGPENQVGPMQHNRKAVVHGSHNLIDQSLRPGIPWLFYISCCFQSVTSIPQHLK